MTYADSLLAAAISLKVNILRSVLTTLGIIIGVAAVIVMVSVGAGARANVERLIESIGSNLIIVVPGSASHGGVRGGLGTAPTLTEGDAEAIQNELESVVIAAPSVSGSAQVIFGNANWFSQIEGITPEYMVARNWSLKKGRDILPEDIRSAAKVAVIGEILVNELFDGQNPIGQTIRIKRVPFEIIGVLNPKGQTAFGHDQDDKIFLPLSTAKRRILGNNQLRGDLVRVIAVSVRSAEEVGTTELQVTKLLQARHRIRPDQANDFSIRNISEFLSARKESSRVMSLLLAAVASVSLLVGGIGIMNIMLVSVTERTREIGLRMALGATGRDIMIQFLIEAVSLSLIGGIIGIVLGLVGSQMIANFADWPMQIEAYAPLMAFGFAASIGVFFGFYPARKAARLDPIEALRFE